MKKTLLVTRFIIFCVIFVGGGIPVHAFGQGNPSSSHDVRLTVVDKATGEPLSFATCFLTPDGGGREQAVATNAKGVCTFPRLSPGRYEFRILCWGQELKQPALNITPAITSYTARVNLSPLMIQEVVVTAQESKGLSTASVIGETAIQHIQPSSIADVLELLPGGKASDPVFSVPQSIHIREAENPVSSDYSTNSLGTQFLIDGVPVNTDANMQSSPNFTTVGYNMGFMNAGVDMRSISTDDIESIEIVRGIPSVEYGDLTTGLVNIKRKQGGHDFNARIKSDMNGKLVYAGKGFEWGDADKLTMNVGADWLDSRADPRNNRQNYQRATAQFRLNKVWTTSRNFRYSLGGSVEYTGSFDNEKEDTDIDQYEGKPLETYKSKYSRLFAKADFSMSAKEKSFFRRLDLTASVTSEWDKIERWRYVGIGGSSVGYIKSVRNEGEYDVSFITDDYEAWLDVDGKPFYGYAKAMATFGAETENTSHIFKLGVNWSMSKNYGEGYLFDPQRPYSLDMDLRQRPFDLVPASHQTAFFLEDVSNVRAGKFDIEWMVGLRASTMLNLGDDYDLNGKVYFDPRANLRIGLPSFRIADRDFRIEFGGGVGWHTKMPTLSQLFPNPVYIDLIQYRGDDFANMRVYKVDPANYGLEAARNFKWEVAANFEYAGNSLSVTYFREDMKSGFRSMSQFDAFTYKDYDETQTYYGPDGRPALSATPFTEKTWFQTWSTYSNGSRTQKEGIEFTFASARIRPIRTRLIVSGAYFRTQYNNSMPVYELPSVRVGSDPFPYIGRYDDDDGYLRESCNTNFTTDTQIPRLGLIFTTSFQCMWFTGTEIMYVDPNPVAYMGYDKVWHPFTEASAADGILSQLIRTNGSADRFTYDEVPFCMNINLKITKKIFRDKLSLSVFANKLLDYTPSYRRDNGQLTRRYVYPYFGMELNIKL